MDRPVPPPIVRPIPQGMPVFSQDYPVATPRDHVRTKRDPLLTAMRRATIIWGILLPVVFLGVFSWKYLTTSNKVESTSYLLEGYRYTDQAMLKMAAGAALPYAMAILVAYLVLMTVLFVMHKTK